MHEKAQSRSDRSDSAAAIHGNRPPCEIWCNNDTLVDEDGNPTEPCIWEFYDQESDQWHELTSLAVPWTDGRLVPGNAQISPGGKKLKSSKRDHADP